MFKTWQNGSMRGVSVRAFGFFLNFSFGRTAKPTAPKRTLASITYDEACGAAAYAQGVLIEKYGRDYYMKNDTDEARAIYLAAVAKYKRSIIRGSAVPAL